MIITQTKPKAQTLYLACELSDRAYKNAFDEWCRESGEPQESMDWAWNDVSVMMDTVHAALGFEALKVDTVHGSGSEMVFPKYDASIYTGYGTLREFERIDEKEAWRHADNAALLEDVLDTYNPYADAFHALYDMLQRFEGDVEDPLVEAFQKLLDACLESVCKVLNQYIEDSEEYAYSEGAFSDWLYRVDDEQWYTESGHLYAVRGGSYFYAVDSGADLEELEGSSAFVCQVVEA